VAKFKFKDAEYDLVTRDDLDFQEIDDLERYTATNLLEGKLSIGGMIWISVRRRYPNTTFADIAKEKIVSVEVEDDEELPERLPPILNGAAVSSTADAPTKPQAPTVSGNPG